MYKIQCELTALTIMSVNWSASDSYNCKWWGNIRWEYHPC